MESRRVDAALGCLAAAALFFVCRLHSIQVSYASLCMHSGDLETTLGKKQMALEKIEHAVAQKHLDPPKVLALLVLLVLVMTAFDDDLHETKRCVRPP